MKINEAAEDFYFRASTVLDAVKVLPENDFIRTNLLSLLNQAINTTDFRAPAQRGVLCFHCQGKPRAEGRPPKPQGEVGQTARDHCVGHSHIDVAWWWQLRHTREKASRTFSTVNHLMEQYPEYFFLQSQPQLYDYIKEDYPEIYDRIKARVKEGKWEVTGGTWVEMDCNVTSGESLVRQFLLGQKFMEREFGVRSTVLWLPDVFGYSWALPQIIKKSGHKYFMTTKISWSQYNRPTYDTFRWRGIDGTEVLTHFITTTESHQPRFYTYNGNLNPKSAVRSWGALPAEGHQR